MTTRARPLAAAIGLSMSAVLPPMLTGTLAERMRESLGIGETTLGVALAVFFATSGGLAASGGRLADRIGWGSAGRIAATGSALCLLGVALLARDVWSLTAWLALGGASLALGMPAGSLAIAQELPPHRQGLLFGVKQTAIPLAGLLAGVSVPAVALTIGWRWAFGLALVFPAATHLLLPRAAQPTAAAPPRARGSGATRPEFRRLALGGGLAAVAISAMAAFLVVAAVDAGIAEGTAGMLVAVASGLGLSVRVGVGWLADRSDSGGFRQVAGMLGLGTVGFALLALHVPVAVGIGALLAYAAGWGWPGLFYFGAVRHQPEMPAAATGAVQVGLSTGSAFGPLLFGVTAERLGFTAAWAGAAALVAVAAVLIGSGARRLGAPPPRTVDGAVRTRRGHGIAYRVTGAGPPLVFLHGWGSDAGHWYDEGYVDRLAGQRQVVAIDLLGHGASDRPHDPAAYRLREMAQDVLDVLDAQDLPAADVWGYSMGGYVAWALAAEHPDRVRRLVLGGAAAGASDPRAPLDHLRPQIDALVRADWDAFWAVAGGRPDEWADAWEAGNDPRALGAALDGLLTSDRPDGTVDVPLRYYVGELDVFAEGVRAAAAARGAPLLVVGGTDHLTVAQHTDELVRFALDLDIGPGAERSPAASG